MTRPSYKKRAARERRIAAALALAEAPMTTGTIARLAHVPDGVTRRVLQEWEHWGEVTHSALGWKKR